MYKCPKCNSTEQLRIVARIAVELIQDDPDNIETEEARNCGGHEWDSDSVMWCNDCNYTGTISDFEECEGTEGQDRESYSDDQDRDNYTVSN